MLSLDVTHKKNKKQNVQEQFKIKYTVILCLTEVLEHSIHIITFLFY